MQHAKNVPTGKNLVTQVREVPGGSIEYRLSIRIGARAITRPEIRREVENAVHQFRDKCTQTPGRK